MEAKETDVPASITETNGSEDKHTAPTITAEIRNRILNFNSQKNRSTNKMVFEAISAVGFGTRGASVPAITKWILANYAIPDSNRLKVSVKKFLMKCIEDGTLVRSETSKGAFGASGSFEFPKEKAKSKTKVPRKARSKTKTDAKVLEDPEEKEEIVDNEKEINNKDEKVRRKSKVQKSSTLGKESIRAYYSPVIEIP